jgi:hypothetical protein
MPFLKDCGLGYGAHRAHRAWQLPGRLSALLALVGTFSSLGSLNLQQSDELRLVLLLERDNVEDAEAPAVADEDLGQLGQRSSVSAPTSIANWRSGLVLKGASRFAFCLARRPSQNESLEGGAAKPKRPAARRCDSPQCKKTPAARVASSTARSSWTGPPSLSERLARHSGATRRRRSWQMLRRTKRLDRFDL